MSMAISVSKTNQCRSAYARLPWQPRRAAARWWCRCRASPKRRRYIRGRSSSQYSRRCRCGRSRSVTLGRGSQSALTGRIRMPEAQIEPLPGPVAHHCAPSRRRGESHDVVNLGVGIPVRIPLSSTSMAVPTVPPSFLSMARSAEFGRARHLRRNINLLRSSIRPSYLTISKVVGST